MTVLFWAGNFVLGRGVHDVIPPVALAFWRWTVALVILLPFAVKPLLDQQHLLKKHWKLLTIFAVLSVTFFNTFIYLAVQSSSAINTLMVNSMTPIFIAIIAWAGFKDRISFRQCFGIVLSFFGLAWIVSRGRPELLLSMQFSRGDLWTLAAAMSWAIYTVILRKRPAQLHPLGFLSAIIAIGIVFLLPLYIWEILSGATLRLTMASIGSIAYVAVFPSVLAYIFWNRAVGEVGATKAGIFMHLMPVFGIILAIIFLGEGLNAYHWPGFGMIIIGILMTTIEPGSGLQHK